MYIPNVSLTANENDNASLTAPLQLPYISPKAPNSFFQKYADDLINMAKFLAFSWRLTTS